MNKINSFLIVIILFTISCKEKEPTAPTADPPTEVLAEATIGPSGGELKTDEFSLIVPEGSFQSENTLSLSTTDDFNYFGENSVSETFVIEGIPSDFNKTLRMAIKYNGTLNDSSYIAITSTTDESFLQDSTYFCEFFSVKDSSGFLVTYIGNDFFSSSDLTKHVSGILDPLVMGQSVTDFINWRGKYFILEGPGRLADNGREFTESMDNIFRILLDDLGFDFKYKNHYQRYNLKYGTTIFDLYIPLIVDSYNETSNILFPNFKFVDGFTYIRFFAGENLLYSAASDRAAINMSFMLLNLIIPMTFNDNQLSSKQELLEAIAWWMEDYMNINDPPLMFKGNMVSLFNGFDYDGISPGLSSLLKYLMVFQKYNSRDLGKVFEDAHDNNINHYYSMISKVDSLITTWFPDYYEKLFKGEVFDIDGSVFLEGIASNPWPINSDSDTSFTFTAYYGDLSVKRILIELNHDFEDESASLLLETSTGTNSDGTAMLVFSVDENNKLEHLVTGRAEQIEIPNLKTYYQNGTKKFLVAVVNCINNGVDYTGVTEIDLTAKIKSYKDNIEGNYNCQINHFAVFDFLVEKKGSDGSLETETFPSVEYGVVESHIYGEIINYSFVGSYQDGPLSAAINISFSNNYESIESLYFTRSFESDIEAKYSYDTLRVVDLPKEDGYADIDYNISGTSYCTILKRANYTETRNWNEAGITYTKVRTITGFNCNDMSGISVTFSKQN